MDMSDAENLKSLFKKYDSNGDGTMSRAELEALVRFLRPDGPADVDAVFDMIDANDNGVIDCEEFVDWLMQDDESFQKLQETPADRTLREQTRGGSLIIIGGGRTPYAACERLLEYAGGSNAKLVVIPTAKASADTRSEDSFTKTWYTYGAASVKCLHTRDRETANSEEFVAPLHEATGVWIGGGNQWRLSDAYLGTAVEAAVYGVLERGGVVMGSSAGAAIQSRLMIAGSQAKAIRGGRDPDADWPPPGFDLFRWTVVDQHFGARGREARLVAKVQEHSGQAENGLDLVGYGIDEHTALVIRAGSATREVIGEGTVTVIAYTPDDDGGRTIKERVLRPEDGVVNASKMLEGMAVGQRGADEEEEEEPKDWEALWLGNLLVGAHFKPEERPPWTGDADSYLASLVDLGFELGPPNGACYFQLLDGTAYVYGESRRDGGPGPDSGYTENENTWMICETERD